MTAETASAAQQALDRSASSGGETDRRERPRPASPQELAPLPPDRVSPQLTARAILTGMVLGGLFSVCNVYAGLRIGLAFNMAIAGILVSYGFWAGLRVASGRRLRYWGILENNIGQTACSAGALVASAGLTGSIPALTMLTGQTLPWHYLSLWVFSVCLVGITVGVALRRQMLIVDKLPFVAGIANAETLREMYARGREAAARAAVLLAAGLISAADKVAEHFWGLTTVAIPGRLHGFSLKALTFGLEPTLLLYGVGGLIGIRAGISLLLGAVLAWGILAPPLLQKGYMRLTVGHPLAGLPAGLVLPPEPAGYAKYDARRRMLEYKGFMTAAQRDELLALSGEPAYQQAVLELFAKAQPTAAKPSFRDMVQWMLWPGVTLMVVASLTSVAFSWRSAADSLRGVRARGSVATNNAGGSSQLLLGILVLALLLSAGLQVALFQIVWWAAIGAVGLSFALALVGARVSGETGITPVAQMAKVSQVVFGALLPASPVPNLMAANVAGGAASQCADLLHDYKCGHLLGAAPRAQTVAQAAGALAGALVASAAYLALIPNPSEQLLTSQWPAPGVAGMKAVAELFQIGFGALPQHAGTAMLLAAGAGLLLPVVERLLPKSFRRYWPSAPSIGLAFVCPASIALTLFVGAMVAFLLGTGCKSWSGRFLIAICAGLVAGESLTGVGISLHKIIAG